MQRKSCVKAASNFLLRLSVGNVGRMNTQIRLLNSLVRLQAGWTVKSLVRCVTRNGWFWFQYTMSKCLLKCLTFCLFSLLTTESQNSNRRVLGNYSPCQNRRMFENKIVSALTWILLSIKFVVLRRRWKRNPGQILPWLPTVTPRNKVQDSLKFCKIDLECAISF